MREIVDWRITKRTKLLEINNDMCHNYYYLINGRINNADRSAYRKFKFVIWFDIFDVDDLFCDGQTDFCKIIFEYHKEIDAGKDPMQSTLLGRTYFLPADW